LISRTGLVARQPGEGPLDSELETRLPTGAYFFRIPMAAVWFGRVIREAADIWLADLSGLDVYLDEQPFECAEREHFWTAFNAAMFVRHDVPAERCRLVWPAQELPDAGFSGARRTWIVPHLERREIDRINERQLVDAAHRLGIDAAVFRATSGLSAS
jgi:hypothetical protein